MDDTQLYAWKTAFPYPASDVAEFVLRLHIIHLRILEDVSKFSLKQFHNVEHLFPRDLPESSLRVS